MKPVLVNPHHVKKSKELDDNNPTTNDHKDLKVIAGLIEELVKQIPMAEKLLEIKGVGIRTVSGFLAEVGDIGRFKSPKETRLFAL